MTVENPRKFRKAQVGLLKRIAKRRMVFAMALLCVFVVAASGCKERKYAYASIPSTAMEPTIKRGTVVTIDFNAYKYGKPVQRWDIVGIKMRGTVVIKRVVGLGGETLSLNPDGESINVNGKNIPVPDYIPWKGKKLHKTPADNPVIGVGENIPEGTFFVIDDNIGIKDDSRVFGAVPRKYITGKVLISKVIGGKSN